MKEFFNDIPVIKYKGASSNDPFSFRYYNPDEVINGKTMREHLKFALSYWHTMCGDGTDMFGRGTYVKNFGASDPMEIYRNKAYAAFELMNKLSVDYYCFHDRDIAPEFDTLEKTNAAQLAFGSAFGNSDVGNIFIAICLLFFAFSTIIGWNLFGRINITYLFGKKANIIYSILAIVFIFLGSIASNYLVWELTDMFNNIMVIPNAIALFALGSLVAVSAKLGIANNKDLKRQKHK